MSDDQSLNPITLEPQEGPQDLFNSSAADIVIYGGAAGGGKSWGLLFEPLRHIQVEGFGAVIFRRTMPQHKMKGGLWDEAMKIYPYIGGQPRSTRSEWCFYDSEDQEKLIATVKHSHLEHEDSVLDWQGAQIPLLLFDELTHFSYQQFFYMIGRNRSMCGVSPYVRATCNPDPDSWVKEFIRWWLDDEGRFPNLSKAGRLRWFIRVNDDLVWANSPEELKALHGQVVLPKSVTFIPANINDNKILLDKDPGYLANLDALPRVERERLKHGDWSIKASAGNVFRSEWFKVIGATFDRNAQRIRFWDRAATEKKADNNPDYTVGVLMAKSKDGRFVVENVVRGQWSAFHVEQAIVNTASQDGPSVQIVLEQEPGASGKSEAQYLTRALAGYSVKSIPSQKNKLTRAGPVSSQVQAGNVDILAGPWNKAFLNELENFPDADKDDQVDAFSGAFNALANVAGDITDKMVQQKSKPIANVRKDDVSW